MAQRIAFFNHKGGVSKTTTTFHLGWMLAEKGKTVILVDADPQCNLTGLALGYESFKNFYEEERKNNLKTALAPAFESMPKIIDAVDCLPVKGRENLFLLPGHVNLSEYEVTLGMAQELSVSVHSLQNLPGSISYLLNKTAKKFKADYILVDLSPSLSSINQNILMTSDFLIVPTNPDIFSVVALDALGMVLPEWFAWAKQASNGHLKRAIYPFPPINLKFLGIIVQKYQPYKGDPATAFQKWVDKIGRIVSDNVVPNLQKFNAILPEQAYFSQGVNDFCLANIPDFKSLIAKSESTQTPVFALSSEQLGETGIVQDQAKKSRDTCRQIFSDLADKVIGLTSYADSH